MPTTQIHVTGCDNELYILASTPRGSSELCHLKSGFGAPVDYKFNPGHILPPGTYELTVVGINWGGPWKFDVTFTGTPPIPPISVSGPGPAAGVVFTRTNPMTTA
jgi:hypothetical protein